MTNREIENTFQQLMGWFGYDSRETGNPDPQSPPSSGLSDVLSHRPRSSASKFVRHRRESSEPLPDFR